MPHSLGRIHATLASVAAFSSWDSASRAVTASVMTSASWPFRAATSSAWFE
jgi:hypothetical protein